MSAIDEVREYWDRRPCNIKHSAAPIGTREYFQQVSTRKYFVERHIEGFADFEHWKGKRVLEIGCGIGTDGSRFAEHGACYTGIDLSSESIKIAKERFHVFGLKGNLLCMDAEHLFDKDYFPEPRLPYDLIYSFGVLHHTPNPERVVNNAHSLLAPDGEFRLMLYAKNSWKAFMIEAGLAQPEAQDGCPIAKTYTEREAIELLYHRGFKVVDMRQDHVFPYVVEDYVKHIYVVEPYIAAMPSALWQMMEKRLGWHMLITAKKR